MRDTDFGETGSCFSEKLALMVRDMFSKSLIQFFVDGWGCVSSLFDLRPNYGGSNEDNGNLCQKVPCMHCCTQCPWSCSRPPLSHASTGDSWTLTDKSGSVSCGVTAPFSWVLVLFVPSKSLFPLSCVSSGSSMVGYLFTVTPVLCSLHASTTQSPLHCFRNLQNTDTTPVLYSCGFWVQMQKTNTCGLAQSCPTLCRYIL